MIKILIIDRDGPDRAALEQLLISSGRRVVFADDGPAGLAKIRSAPLDLVIMENDLPGLTGLEVLEQIRSTNPRLPVIMTSPAGATENVIEAAKLGAFDCLPRPTSDEEILRVVGMALEAGRLMRSPLSINPDPDPSARDALVGASRPMREIYKAIGRVAPTDATVLIRGESGCGKELVAQAIYQHSDRNKRPFVVVNCVAIPESLLESELFGYERGAFTGADQRRIGKIEHANGGTVFLDEIGDVPVSIQAKLLRLLQEKTIERIGGNKPIKVDVRVIAATNADLERKISTDRFREDLYYRLNVVSLNLPPLRERPEDIPALAHYFMNKFSKDLAVRNPGLTPEAIDHLVKQSWPGNVRELANVIEKCLIFSRGRPVGVKEVRTLALGEDQSTDRLTNEFDRAVVDWIRDCLDREGANRLTEMTDLIVKLIISEALEACDNNRSRTARLLGVSRPTLLYKIDKYGLGKKTGE